MQNMIIIQTVVNSECIYIQYIHVHVHVLYIACIIII